MFVSKVQEFVRTFNREVRQLKKEESHEKKKQKTVEEQNERIGWMDTTTEKKAIKKLRFFKLMKLSALLNRLELNGMLVLCLEYPTGKYDMEEKKQTFSRRKLKLKKSQVGARMKNDAPTLRRAEGERKF
ncbi:hypothetical protein RUM44_003070 [Polyplax serrata]|uniref:Uncharacterized protein n=1 Tax=Polyplax serrata TaxID=468196 RepID=A0ABR1AXG6_POLSC